MIKNQYEIVFYKLNTSLQTSLDIIKYKLLSLLKLTILFKKNLFTLIYNGLVKAI